MRERERVYSLNILYKVICYCSAIKEWCCALLGFETPNRHAHIYIYIFIYIVHYTRMHKLRLIINSGNVGKFSSFIYSRCLSSTLNYSTEAMEPHCYDWQGSILCIVIRENCIQSPQTCQCDLFGVNVASQRSLIMYFIDL